MKFLYQINLAVLAILLLLPLTRTPGLAQTFNPTYVGVSQDFKVIRDIEWSTALNLESTGFNSKYANDSDFIFEEIGAASGTASFTKTQKRPENRFDPLNLAIGAIVVSLIGLIIYRASDSEFPLTK